MLGKPCPCQSDWLREVEIEPNVEVGMCIKVLLFEQHTGARAGMEELARTRARCAWTKFRELSPILAVRGASSIYIYEEEFVSVSMHSHSF